VQIKGVSHNVKKAIHKTTPFINTQIQVYEQLHPPGHEQMKIKPEGFDFRSLEWYVT
jgi:hypothetical protein